MSAGKETADLIYTEPHEQLHRECVVVDTSAALSFYRHRNFVGGRSGGHYDLRRAMAGGVTAVVFEPGAEELFVSDPTQGTEKPPPKGVKVMEAVFSGPEVVKRVLWELDALAETVVANQSRMVLALTAEDVEEAKRDGKFAAIMGLSACWIDSDLAALRSYYGLGLRVMELVHGAPLGWVSSSRDLSAEYDGLTDFGRDVVRECNRIGVVVDLAHACDQSFLDTVEVAERPVLVSHTGCRALVDHQRNLTDAQLEAVARNGGVVGITSVPSFVDTVAGPAEWRTDYPERLVKAHRALARNYPDPFDLMRAFRDPEPGSPYVVARPDVVKAKVPLERMIDHIDHAAKIMGIDHVAIGTDFDGIDSTLQGFEDASKFPEVTRLMLGRGYSNEDIRKILGANFLRLFGMAAG